MKPKRWKRQLIKSCCRGVNFFAICRQKRPELHFDNPLDIDNDLEKITNIIQSVDFVENMKDMERFDEIAKEFVELKTSIRFEPSSTAQLAQNRGKNRYMNVLPNESTRVRLNQPNDFINANRVNYQNGRSYIATQAPLPGTKEDFWLMVWQERVSLIVMLTNLVEGGKTKSDHYWPYDQQREEACEGLTIEMVILLNF